MSICSNLKYKYSVEKEIKFLTPRQRKWYLQIELESSTFAAADA
jgi:hypothetical protein